MRRAPVVRFTLRAVLFALPVLAYVVVAFVLFMTVPNHPYQVLQSFQESKLESETGVEVVFVGDSSLGNAIDTAQFSEETGREAVSLALTGYYGFGGAYGMSRRAIQAYPELRTIVVVLSPDTFARPRSTRGLLVTTPLGEIAALDPEVRGGVLEEAVDLAFSTEVMWFPFKLLFGRKPDLERWLPASDGRPPDYAGQLDKQVRPNVRDFGEVRPGKIEYLQALARLGERHGVRVVYMTGPYWRDQLEANGPYLDAAERDLASSGVPFVRGWVEIPSEELGDAADHVAPVHKATYTSRYARALAPYLE